MKKVGRIFRESLINKIKEDVNNNTSIFIINYSKLSGVQFSDFRRNLKQVGVRVQVVRNTMAKRAFREENYEELVNKVEGSTALVYGNADSVEISKILVKFAKECEGFVVRGGLLEKKILNEEDVQRLSELPSKDVLLSMLLGTIQSPLTRLASALNAKTRELLSILKQLSEKKQ